MILSKHGNTFLLVTLMATTIGMAESPLLAAKLRDDTLKGWNKYVHLTEKRMEKELTSSEGFLVQDFQSSPKSRADRQDLLAGKTLVTKMKTLDYNRRKISVPGGTIHHWRGSILIPNVSIEQVLAQVREPADKEDLQKDILESRVLEENADSIRLYIKLVRSKIITVTYNTEHLIHYRRHAEDRASSQSTATKIAELEHVNTPSEREKSAGEDRGFLWRMNSYWRYQQVDSGVLVECESLTLSRGIPALLYPLVRPIVSSVAQQSMKRTLVSMRSRFSVTRG